MQTFAQKARWLKQWSGNEVDEVERVAANIKLSLKNVTFVTYLADFIEETCSVDLGGRF